MHICIYIICIFVHLLVAVSVRYTCVLQDATRLVRAYFYVYRISLPRRASSMQMLPSECYAVNFPGTVN